MKKKSSMTIRMSKMPGKATARAEIEIFKPGFFDIARRGLRTLISLKTLIALRLSLLVK
jgi:hypothetical protein